MAAAVSHEPSESELNDGSLITLREVRPKDKVALAAGFAKLSQESRYRRFFSALDRLSETDLRYLTEVDHRDHEAVVAFEASGEPVGVARYVRVDEDSAEVAVAVVDAWQGRGAGTALLERLTKRASENGVERFIALVLPENAEAIELFHSVSGESKTPPKTDDGYLEMEIEVPTDGVAGTPLGRALRSAAGGRVVIHPWRLIKERLQGIRQDDGAGPEQENRPDR